MCYVKIDRDDFIGYERGDLYAGAMAVEEALNSSEWCVQGRENIKNKIGELFHTVLERDGVEEVAKRIRNSGERFNQLLGCILYGRDGRRDLERDLVEMAVILYGRPLSFAELRRWFI